MTPLRARSPRATSSNRARRAVGDQSGVRGAANGWAMAVPGRLLVAVTGAVTALSAIAAVAAGLGSADDRAGPATTTAGPPASARVDVAIAEFAFAPQELTVAVGTEVTWTNADGFAHSVVTADGVLDSADLAEGDAFAHLFDTPGTYAYLCGIHNSMTATVVVTG